MEASCSVCYRDGWSDKDREDYFSSRAMGSQARLSVSGGLWHGCRFVSIPVSAGAGGEVLKITVNAETIAGSCGIRLQPDFELTLLQGWHIYDCALPAALRAGDRSDLDLGFCLSVADPIRVGPVEFHDDLRRHEKARRFYAAAKTLQAGEGRRARYLPDGGGGWDKWEFQNYMPFRWSRLHANVVIPEALHQGHRYCTVPISSEFRDLSQLLTITADNEALLERPLARYWNSYTFDLPAARQGPLNLVFRLNKLLPQARHPGDGRELGVKVGPFEFHDDETRKDRHEWAYRNMVVNTQEVEAAASELRSFPPSLGIDLYGKCNIKPPCAYCWWDHAKGLEGDNLGAIVDDTTLQDYGPFFDAAQTLVNCSFGEPLLHPRLGQTVSLVTSRDKVLELATNGQSFTPETVDALAGQAVLLYVSLDAASADVYARLRNDRWHDVLAGLLYLREARRRAHGLPTLRMVFMPMRANLGDLEAYFRLARLLEAEAVVLRPLNFAEQTGMSSERGGYRFEYDRELLTREEIGEVSRHAAEYAGRYGMWLIDQHGFGG